jgi:hypothetical protein
MYPPFPKSHVGIIPGLVIVITSLYPHLSSTAQQSAPQCTPAGAVVRVPELSEGSGLAASRRTDGRFWSHNDSGDPVLIALDGNGRIAGRLQLSGARVEDWEAVAVGPCPAGSCIYVADIGDNGADRNQITIYRLAEPAEPGGSAKVSDVIRATYPDGAHDAEALLVAPDGRLYIVTKGETGPVALYRFPSNPAGATVRLERVGKPRDQRSSGENERITDGAVSPDGRWIVLRSRTALTFYPATDLLSGNWREAARVSLASVGEPQGEGVTFGPGNSVYLMSEGGGRKQPGMFARLACTVNP